MRIGTFFRVLCWLGTAVTVIAVFLGCVSLMMLDERRQGMHGYGEVASSDGVHRALVRAGDEPIYNPRVEVWIDGETVVGGEHLLLVPVWKDARTLVLRYKTFGPHSRFDERPAAWKGIAIRYEPATD